MTSVLLVEDREILKSLFSDLIHNYWPEDQSLEIESCSFSQVSKLIPEKKRHIYIFNIASNSAVNFDFIKSLVQNGQLNQAKVIVSSVNQPPKIVTEQEVEICYCNEDRFGAECLPLMLEESPIYSSLGRSGFYSTP